MAGGVVAKMGEVSRALCYNGVSDQTGTFYLVPSQSVGVALIPTSLFYSTGCQGDATNRVTSDLE